MSWKNFWSIPVLTAYVYVITILAQFGYNSYFNVPSTFLDSSIAANTVYIYFLQQILSGVLQSTHWWQWVVPISFLLIILGGAWYFYLLRPSKVSGAILVIALAIFLWQSVNFGSFIARNQPVFFVAPADCLKVKSDSHYIVATFTGTKAVFVPINENKKLLNGLLVRELSDLPCELQYDFSAGPVVK